MQLHVVFVEIEGSFHGSFDTSMEAAVAVEASMRVAEASMEAMENFHGRFGSCY